MALLLDEQGIAEAVPLCVLGSMSGTPSFARRRPISLPVRPVDVSASTSQTDSTIDDGHISSSVLATWRSVAASPLTPLGGRPAHHES